MSRDLKIQLHEILTERLDLEELRTLCFYVDVEYDHLRGEGQPSKARELIRHLDKRSALTRLAEAGQKLRPEIAWPVSISPGGKPTLESEPEDDLRRETDDVPQLPHPDRESDTERPDGVKTAPTQAPETEASAMSPIPTIIEPIRAAEVQVGGEYSVLNVTTPLGIQTSVEIDRTHAEIDSGNRLLNYLLSRRWKHKTTLPVRIADGVHVLVPLGIFRRADALRDGMHLVTLADEQTIQGQLDFALRTADRKRVYDFRAAEMVTLVNLTEFESQPMPREGSPTSLWQLRTLAPIDLAHSVFNPRFIVQILVPAIRLGGQDPFEVESQTFYLNLGDKEHLVNLSDLDEIRFDEQDQITLNRASSGTLIFRVQRNNQTKKGRAWLLAMDCSDSELKIALENPRAVLRRTSV